MAHRAGRGLVAICCCVTALVAGFGQPAGAATQATAPPIPPHAWIVADAGTGAILESHNEHVAYHPASTTKVMTALTAVERLPPNAMIKVDALTASQPASKIGMLVGQQWTLDDTLASLLVVSANDAAYALAQAVAPTLPGFVQAETTTAHQLGLRDSTFADPAGLDDGAAYNGGPLMSAYDIAISARNALAVPILAGYAASPLVTFVGPGGVHHQLTNHNKLVSQHLYAGATGFKTGFTDKAGHTLIATATRNGRTLIAVILGTDDAYGWASRFLDAGFSDSATIGAKGSLPPVRITTYSQRAAQFAAFHQLASGSKSGSQSSSSDTSQSSSGSPTSAAHARSSGTVAASALGGTLAASHAAKKAGHGHSATTIVIAVLLLLLAILYLLRVRAVRRARARRLARRREAHNMMRRGSLPIVDGRYRTGTRVGKPVESHVQIRREREEQTRRERRA